MLASVSWVEGSNVSGASKTDPGGADPVDIIEVKLRPRFSLDLLLASEADGASEGRGGNAKCGVSGILGAGRSFGAGKKSRIDVLEDLDDLEDLVFGGGTFSVCTSS
jgi:hypothetical protein